MRIRALKLRDEFFGDQWFDEIEDRWEYNDSTSRFVSPVGLLIAKRNSFNTCSGAKQTFFLPKVRDASKPNVTIGEVGRLMRKKVIIGIFDTTMSWPTPTGREIRAARASCGRRGSLLERTTL